MFESRMTRAAARVAALLFSIAITAALGVASSCGTVAGSSPRGLANAQTSPDALARQFLAYLAADDIEGMKSLRVTGEEFRAYVFPELPVSRTPNVTSDWVWEQATLKSMAGMSRMLAEHKGERFDFVSVRAASTERYATYAVLKSPVVTVRDASGATRELRLFGSMLELDGQYKLMSFVVD